MGVPKLTSFITHNYKWKDMVVRGDLVIDGSALCYNLYFKLYKWELGGEYCEFYRTVREYFEGLNSLGIHAYVVMDGIDFDDSKKATHDRRCEQKIVQMSYRQPQPNQMMPLFAKSVFLDAARDCSVSCFVADGEADQSIVSLANHLHCPVLGNDSDFFIFNIDHGYIPIQDSNRSIVNLRSPVKYFQARDFDCQFSLSPEQRLFLPLKLGNDIFPPALLSTSPNFVHKIMIALKRKEIDDRSIGDHALRRLAVIQAYYTAEPQSFEDLSSSRSLSVLYPSTPRWILDRYKRGLFSANVLHLMLSKNKAWRYLVVVEVIRRPSAWKVAEELLLYIIGVVLGEQDPVLLTDRNGKRLHSTQQVGLVVEHFQIPSLADIPQMPVTDRQDIVINIFQCQSIAGDIKSAAVIDKLKIAIIASHFWLKVDRSYSKWLKALVCSILVCSRSKPPRRIDRFLLKSEENELFHPFAQWQCILHHAITLNQVLDGPFPEAVSSPTLFSLVAVQHYNYYRNEPKPSKEAELLIELIKRL